MHLETRISDQNVSTAKHRSCLENLYNYVTEYCTNTSIHGFKFLGEKGRSVFERIWWLSFLGASLYFCVILILQAYEKWELSPVVVSFATSETPIWKIPFPAVTICPQTKARKDFVNFTKLVMKERNGEKLTPEETKQLEYMSSICSNSKTLIRLENLSKTIDSDDVINFLMKVKPLFYSSVHECYWLGRNCSTDVKYLFIPILTTEGVCYSFNLLDRDETFTKVVANDYYTKFSIPHQARSQWSLEKGYDKGSDLSAFPRRTPIGGSHGGLDLILYLNVSDLDYLCGDALPGYKVILHNPLQIPFVKQKYFRVGLNKDITVAVKPTIMTTSKQLTHYTPSQRKCFFEEEKKLKFFKVYDQNNCIHECVSDFTYKHCDCVAFYMLRDNSTPVCGPGKQSCMREAASVFLAKDVNFMIKHFQGKPNRHNSSNKEYIKDCKCFPTCNSLNFETEISQSDWSWREGAQILGTRPADLLNSVHLSRLQIFFKDMQFITSERNELYGQMDFLASCGGLLGLFIGFSFISVVEIVYYATLRLACNLRKYGSGNWSGTEELLEVKVDEV